MCSHPSHSRKLPTELALTEMSKAELLQMLEAIHQATIEDKKTIEQLTTANRKLRYRCNFLVRELNNAEAQNKQA